jgi:hypothetical protein
MLISEPAPMVNHQIQCPINKAKRNLVGLQPRQRAKSVLCETLIGISTDEAHRMKPSREAWSVHRWPLIEKGMSRWDCIQWMAKHGYPEPPKSSCIGCPFHSDNEWRALRDDPESWADAVEIDKIIPSILRLKPDVLVVTRRSFYARCLEIA